MLSSQPMERYVCCDEKKAVARTAKGETYMELLRVQ